MISSSLSLSPKRLWHLFCQFTDTCIWLSLIVGVSLTFLVAHLLLLFADNQQLNRYIATASENSRQLHSAVVSTFKHTNSDICTAQNITLMREDLWQYPLIKDIAYVKDGLLVCSATWGQLDPTPVLQKPTKTWPKHSYQHWRNVFDPIMGSTQLNMISNGRLLILIAPEDAYARIPSSYQHIGFVVSTKDKNYVFHSTGPLNNDAVLTQTGPSFTMLMTQRCDISPQQRECITAYNSEPGLLGKGPWFITLVGALSLTFSTLLYSFILFAISHKKSLKRALKRAIAKQEISVLFQPKIDLTNGRTVGVETLARWHDKHFGHVPPDIFVAVAEKHGLMPSLSRLVIQKALHSAGSLLHADPSLHLSINLTMADMSDPQLLDFIDDHCAIHGVAPDQLIFEITENSASGFDGIESSVTCFTSHGYHISLDDFGTGYANLSWLSKIKATEIKVDRSFTQMIGDQDPYNRNTLSAIFQLLKDLNISAVFEGIETQEQVDYILAHIPNAIGQGWLFAKAMPIYDVHHFITKASANTSSTSQRTL